MARFLEKFAVCNVSIPLAGEVPAELYAQLPRANFIDGHVWDKLQTLGITPSDAGRRCHLPAPGLPRRDRPIADARGSAGVPRRHVAGQAGEAGGPPAGAAGVRRLLGEQVGRPAAAQPLSRRHQGGLQPRRLAARRLPQEQAVRSVRARDCSRPRAARSATARRSSSATAASRTRSPPWSASSSSACGWTAPAAITTRSRSGGRTISTAWPPTSPGSAARAVGLSPPISGGEEIFFAGNRGEVRHPVTGKVLAPRPLGGSPRDDRRGPRSARGAGRVAHGRRQPVLRPRHRQSRVGRPDGPRPGRAGGRSAGHQPAQQRPAARRARRRVPQAAVRPEEAHPHDHDFPRLRPQLGAERRETWPTRATTPGTIASGCGRRCCSMPSATSPQVPETFAAAPPGTRAMELWTVRTQSVFLDSFGRPDPNQDPPCERTSDTTVVQALHLMNAPNLHRKVTADTGRAALLAQEHENAARDRGRALPAGVQSVADRRGAGRLREVVRGQRRQRAGRRRKIYCGRC